MPDWRSLASRTSTQKQQLSWAVGSGQRRCVQRLESGEGIKGQSGTAARVRHEAASSLRHLKRFKQSDSEDLAAEGLRLQAQGAAG